MNATTYKIGLVLSGGGARGFAHLGVIKALHEKEIYPEIISGVSAGAIVGALYADGYGPEEILDFFTERRLLRYLEFGFPNKGLVRITGIARVLKERLKADTFEDLKIPLIVGATDLNNGKVKYFSSGSIKDAVLASSTIPGLVKPLVIDGITYVDGGVLDNFPVKPIWRITKKTIGVHLNPDEHKEDFPNLITILETAFHLAVAKNVKYKSKRVDLFLEPSGLSSFHITDVNKARKIFDMGYSYASEILKDTEF